MLRAGKTKRCQERVRNRFRYLGNILAFCLGIFGFCPRAPWHGHCAEVGAISQCLDNGQLPTAGTSVAVNIGASGTGHGTIKDPCSSCEFLLDTFVESTSKKMKTDVVGALLDSEYVCHSMCDVLQLIVGQLPNCCKELLFLMQTHSLDQKAISSAVDAC